MCAESRSLVEQQQTWRVIILANICQGVYISDGQNSHQYWMKETSSEANAKNSLECP